MAIVLHFFRKLKAFRKQSKITLRQDEINAMFSGGRHADTSKRLRSGIAFAASSYRRGFPPANEGSYHAVIH